MIGRGLFILTILSNCVLSLPVTPSQLENEDAQVMKCIVEALADVLSRPHPNPVSQECLVTLRTDDRLVSILRHHNFLKELQEIAVQGGHDRAQLQREATTPASATQSLQSSSDFAAISDRSMLEALGGPGERSILSQKKRTGHVDRGEEKDESLEDGEPQEDNNTSEEVQVKRENDESPGSHASEDEWSEEKPGKREEKEEESDLNSNEKSAEGNMAKEKKGKWIFFFSRITASNTVNEAASWHQIFNYKKWILADGGEYSVAGPVDMFQFKYNRKKSFFFSVFPGARSDERRDAHRNKSKERKLDEEEKDKRSVFSSHKQEQKHPGEEEEEETKRGSIESMKRWTKRGKALSLQKKAAKKDVQQLNSQEEVAHHSKEVPEEVEEKKKRNTQRSPEEKELQMIARSGAEERRGSEEEGSANRKTEEPEIESLAAIESELENVAQKLHELRRG
ncbi:chromogranin-A [Labrus mixtus]|uniref:chromogranin-A n=1 Tax=Labrus mixtus TaxID=508554 RepID=UPI0029C0EEDB|nr:chromogranin-A [Labrus mixtus]